eukprot:COSAG02_NODE_18819_length_917_cov_0.614914_1_plen_169_part_10
MVVVVVGLCDRSRRSRCSWLSRRHRVVDPTCLPHMTAAAAARAQAQAVRARAAWRQQQVVVVAMDRVPFIRVIRVAAAAAAAASASVHHHHRLHTCVSSLPATIWIQSRRPPQHSSRGAAALAAAAEPAAPCRSCRRRRRWRRPRPYPLGREQAKRIRPLLLPPLHHNW